MTTTHETERDERRARKRTGVIDCDVHHALPRAATLEPYLAERWYGEYGRLAGRRTDSLLLGVRPAPDIYRQDSFPTGGGTPGSSLELMQEQFLDPFDVRAAVLNPLEILNWPTYGPLANALIAALNDWTIAEWFERDSRLLGTIAIPLEDPLAAVAEIERTAVDERFVGVLFTILTRDPLGHPKYRPVFECAAAHDLPVIVHVGGFSGSRTAAGPPQLWVESHTSWPQAYIAQATSLACSRLFDDFPNLQIVLEEGGFGWLPSLLWRLDRTWELLHEEAAEFTRPPSQVIREHFWTTTQPMDEPETPAQLVEFLDYLDMDDRILFASDYPHWDFDDPARVFPAAVGRERRERFLRTNAEHLFRLGDR